MKPIALTAAWILMGTLFADFRADCKGSPGNRAAGTDPAAIRFFVGSSDGSLDRSIFLCRLNPGKQTFEIVDSFPGARGPSYLAFGAGRDILYAIDKTVADPQTGYMSVTSFSFDPVTGALKYLNSQSSMGRGPCHVSASRNSPYLFTANYSTGNVVSFPLAGDGRILPAASVVQSSGTGPVENRQEGPHTHYVSLDHKENHLLSPDLGSDKVLVYKFHPETGRLVPNPAQEYLEMSPGAGPRHLDFHPSGDYLYVVNELNATVTACRYDADRGVLTVIGRESTVPGNREGSKYPAAIRVHPNGNHLYASTRGEKSALSVFGIDGSGGISRIQVVEGVPYWPRDFNIDPSGRYLLSAGERSGEIELFNLDPETGRLSRTGVRADLPAPGCIVFID